MKYKDTSSGTAITNIKPSRLFDCLQSCRTVYFCGLSKNAGKTVAMMQTMQEARSAGKQVAVTSIGRDGEKYDAIYNDFEKPLIHLMQGDLVITAEGLLPTGACEIVHRFRIRSPLGSIVAACINTPCTIEVAGPSTVEGLRTVKAWVMGYGVDLFLVDGALDRKAASLPDVSDGLVISSGAAVSENMTEVILETRSMIDMLQVPAEGMMSDQPRLNFSPVFDSENELTAAFGKHNGKILTIVIDGAVTERLVDFLMHKGLFPRSRIVADCFAKIFINRKRWHDYRNRGLNISFARSINVLSLTINPVSPSGPAFDASVFLKSMRAAISDVPVFDVQSTHYGLH